MQQVWAIYAPWPMSGRRAKLDLHKRAEVIRVWGWAAAATAEQSVHIETQTQTHKAKWRALRHHPSPPLQAAAGEEEEEGQEEEEVGQEGGRGSREVSMNNKALLLRACRASMARTRPLVTHEQKHTPKRHCKQKILATIVACYPPPPPPSGVGGRGGRRVGTGGARGGAVDAVVRELAVTRLVLAGPLRQDGRAASPVSLRSRVQERERGLRGRERRGMRGEARRRGRGTHHRSW